MTCFDQYPSWRRLVRPSLVLAFSLLALAAAGCDLLEEDDDDSGNNTETVTINVAALVGSEQAACDTDYAAMGSASSTVQLRDLRFYLSDIHLENSAGEDVELELDQDGQWQYGNVALIDLEDATGHCADEGTAETNGAITGTIKKGSYSGIAFNLGVPFDLNHTGTASAESPLNLEAMAWSWQAGRKFAKIDFLVGGTDDYFVHLGSTACEADSAEDAPVAECGKPNRPSMHLHDFDPDEDTLTVDLAAFVADVDMTLVSGMMGGCMSGADDANCEEVFPNFGLDLDSGECVDECHGQTLFTF